MFAQVMHQRALWIAYRAERQRRRRAHHIPEPRDRLADIGNSEADMVGANQAELALADVVGPRATRRKQRSRRRARDHRRALLQEISPITTKTVAHTYHLSRDRTELSRRVEPLTPTADCRCRWPRTARRYRQGSAKRLALNALCRS